jgi:outer membrane protein OmpA-like peptidoglycan-associated protein
LKAIKFWIKNAKHVKSSGFTETDGKGKALIAINKLLAKKRAQNIVNQLKALGLKAKLWINPVGAKQPVSKVQSKNRRVELIIRF